MSHKFKPKTPADCLRTPGPGTIPSGNQNLYNQLSYENQKKMAQIKEEQVKQENDDGGLLRKKMDQGPTSAVNYMKLK